LPVNCLIFFHFNPHQNVSCNRDYSVLALLNRQNRIIQR